MSLLPMFQEYNLIRIQDHEQFRHSVLQLSWAFGVFNMSTMNKYFINSSNQINLPLRQTNRPCNSTLFSA